MSIYKIPQLTSDFGDPAREVEACRTNCALFDFSFVRRASVLGTNAAATVETFAGRSIGGLEDGKIRYAIRLNGNGTICSDITLWKMSNTHFQIMSGHHQDIDDLQELGGSTVTDLTDDTAIFAVQGPNAFNVLAPLCKTPERLEQLRYFEWTSLSFAATDCLVGRLGYTGEAGFELICAKSSADQLWSLLAKHIVQAGFIAADTLRIEAGFPLFWNDFALPVYLNETGLGSFSNTREQRGNSRLQRVSFSAEAEFTPTMWRPKEPPARPKSVGELAVTSACFSQRAERVLGLGYILQPHSTQSADLFDRAGDFTNIRLERLPFYDPTKDRPRAAWS